MFKRNSRDKEKDRTRLVSSTDETVSGAAGAPASDTGGSLSLPADAWPGEGIETPVLKGAPFGLRFRAAIFDHLLVFVFLFVCGLPVSFAFLTFAATGYLPEGQNELLIVVVYWLVIGASFLFPLAYFATWESSWLQATQGKLLFGLKVTGEDGKRVSRTHGLAKALAQFGFLLFAGLIATVPAGIASHFLYDSMHMWTGWAPFLVFGAVDLVLIAVLTCLPLIGGRTVLDLVARKQIVLASDLAKMPAPGKKEGARSILRFVWDFSTALLSIVLCGLVFITLMGGLYSGGDYCARWWQSTGPTLARVEEGIRLQNAGDAEAARVQFDQARSSSKLAVYPYLMGHGASNLFLPLPQLSLYFAEREIAVGEPAFQAGAYRYRAEALEMLGRKEEAMAAYKKILAPETGGADDNLKGLAREGLKRLQ